MSVTYKDIDQLSQKSTVAGTEKIPVSDSLYLTTAQIASAIFVDVVEDGLYVVDSGLYIGSRLDATINSADCKLVVHLTDESELPASPDADTMYLIDEESPAIKIVYLLSESQMPANPDSNTLYVIKE